MMNKEELRAKLYSYANETFQAMLAKPGAKENVEAIGKSILEEFDRMQKRIEELENYICDKFSEDIVLSIGNKILVYPSKDISYIDEDDLPAWCGFCGKQMQIVRPGKWQCVNPDCEYCE